MTFPVDIHNQKGNALYDTGAGCSLINYSMYEKLGMNIDKGYQPTIKSSTGEDMGALRQVPSHSKLMTESNFETPTMLLQSLITRYLYCFKIGHYYALNTL